MLTSLNLVGQEIKQSEAQPESTSSEGKVYYYNSADGSKIAIEVFTPEVKSKSLVPGIIFFHGGAWSKGSRSQFIEQCKYFTKRGLVTATADYRLFSAKAKKVFRADKANKGKSYKRHCVTDAKSAIRWFKKNASTFGLDPEKVIAGGGSAGGHICLLATSQSNTSLDNPKDDKDDNTSVVAYLLYNPALQSSDQSDPEINFTSQIHNGISPSIVFFGSLDKNWLKGWNKAYEILGKVSKPNVNYYMAPKQEHSFFNQAPWREITTVAADRFLVDQGLLAGKPLIELDSEDPKLIKK